MIILDGRKMITRGGAHSYMMKQFHFPFYYGKNLDAFWDLLMSISDPTDVYLFFGSVMLKEMPEYGKKIIATLREAEEENENIKFWTNLGDEIL